MKSASIAVAALLFDPAAAAAVIENGRRHE